MKHYENRRARLSAASNEAIQALHQAYRAQWPEAPIAWIDNRIKSLNEATKAAYVRHLRILILLVKVVPGWQKREQSRGIVSRSQRLLLSLGRV